jgi:pyocin large subunit-like protein
VGTTLSSLGIATNRADDVVRLGTNDSWGNLNTLDDHFARHGADFAAGSADDYARQASEFLQQPGTLTKIDPKTGVIRVYDPATNTFRAAFLRRSEPHLSVLDHRRFRVGRGGSV